MTTIVDGKAAAAALRAQVAEAAAVFAARAGRPAGLDVVLVGDDPASAVYVRNKAKACEAAGMRGAVHRLPTSTTQAELLALLAALQSDDATDGVLVQLPLPKHIDSQAVLVALDPARDVDGFHPLNAGALLAGGRASCPAPPGDACASCAGRGCPSPGRAR
jgi:methylenetetrahydrofolate dehydrogenase (NADP+)/methenyltetrahydrofolate cyclohydrolase